MAECLFIKADEVVKMLGVNSTNRVYENDIQEMKTMLEQLWEANNSVLEKLAAID